MNQCQKIQLERIRLGGFNSFDGEVVAADLEKHESLYKAFMFGRFGYAMLIELRDLAEDCINADTIMFLTTTDNLDKLLKLLKKWKVDEVGYIKAVKSKIGVSHYPEYEFVGTTPFNDDRQLVMAMGSSLTEGQVLIRAWWD